jgi:hypothetical protein
LQDDETKSNAADKNDLAGNACIHGFQFHYDEARLKAVREATIASGQGGRFGATFLNA